MKTVSAAALTELAKLHGTEPLIIVALEWSPETYTLYADKELPGVKSKILQIGALENVLTADNSQSQSVDITFDDTDGELKEIINLRNVHKVTCVVYQYFGALSDLDDKFLLFKGQISTPVVWGEDDRTVQLTILSEIENYEVGFSPEEGQLDFVSDAYIGKPWPLCFGSVVHVPAQRVNDKFVAFLDEEIRMLDPTLRNKQDILIYQYNQAATMFTFMRLLMQGVDNLCRPAGSILVDYVRVIIEEDLLMVDIYRLLLEITEAQHDIESDPANRDAHINRRQNAENMLQLAAFVSQVIQARKEALEEETKLARYEHDMKQHAAQGMIDAYNQMQQLLGQYADINAQICTQQQLSKDCFRVRDGNKFEQGVSLELIIENLTFRGSFDGDVFCTSTDPYARYKNIALGAWSMNDDTCAVQDETNNIDTIFLAAEPPPNLSGMWLLVKAKGDASNVRHIAKVVSQKGNEVKIELNRWSNAATSSEDAGQPRGISLDTMIGAVKDIPIVPGPWGQPIPAGLFNDNLIDPNLIARPETEELRAIIASIPGGVNEHELEVLATLVFLKPWDDVSSDVIIAPVTPRQTFTVIAEDIESITEAAGVVLQSWLDQYDIPPEELPESIEWVAEAGTPVSTNAKDCIVYVANILPSTIHAVHAYRTQDNRRFLAPVPSKYYVKNESANLGTINVTALTFPINLASIADEGWEEDVYVTLTSSVGPNVVDIIAHLINTYSSGTPNAANFADIKAKFVDGSDELYPANFALFDRPNVLDEISRIAWEARCAIYRVGDEFFLKYLSEEPTEDVTFTMADIETQTLKVNFTPTEELCTRLLAVYNRNYLPLEDNQKPDQLAYRHNMPLYGLHHREETFHIYNIPELVEKSATFWLIRLANTWKTITFKTFTKHLRLDTFDTILFNLGRDYFAEGSIKGVVRTATYNPDDQSIDIECWLPIRAGEMQEYYWAWPAQKDEEADFPTSAEIEEGLGGGYGPGTGVTGRINDCGA